MILDLEEERKKEHPLRTPSERDPRCNTFGQGGFMSPMRRVAEATCRIPEVQDTDMREAPSGHIEENESTQENEERDMRLNLRSPIREVSQAITKPQMREREGNIQEPEIIVEQALLLNGGPPTARELPRSLPVMGTTTTTTVSMVQTPPIESVSLSSTPPVSSTGVGERIPMLTSVTLTEEEPQIRCSICGIIDCMIHSP